MILSQTVMKFQSSTSGLTNLFLFCSIVMGMGLMTSGVLHSDEGVQFPEGFRRWVHVGTGVVLPSDNSLLKSEEGMHHVFANSKAAEAYATGEFPDGSILVYELREAQPRNGVISEGDRRRVE
jgi:cytochrome P460